MRITVLTFLAVILNCFVVMAELKDASKQNVFVYQPATSRKKNPERPGDSMTHGNSHSSVLYRCHEVMKSLQHRSISEGIIDNPLCQYPA